MDNMKKCNFLISGISVMLGIAIMVLSKDLSLEFTEAGPGAGFWPFILGICLTMVGVILCVMSIVKGKELEKMPVVLNAPANMRVYIMMGVIVVFCVILSTLGFYIAAILFVPVTMYLLDVRSVKKILITTVILVASIYVIFGVLLNTTLPEPFFMA